MIKTLKVPEHIKRMDLTKELNFSKQFMDDKCKECSLYRKCSEPHQKMDYLGKAIVDGKYIDICPRNITRAFRDYKQLQALLVKKGILTKETLDDYVGTKSINSVKTLGLISEMPDVYKGNYYLFGDNSTQKTTMAKATAKVLCYAELNPHRISEELKSFSVEFTNMNTIMSLLSKSLDYDVIRDDQQKVEYELNKYRNADWLFIDESFDPSKATYYKTGHLLGELDLFLRYRLEDERKSTVFISNINVNDIDENLFGKSIKALVERSTLNNVLLFEDNYLEHQKNIIPTRNLI